jgi:hypothetical protein
MMLRLKTEMGNLPMHFGFLTPLSRIDSVYDIKPGDRWA